MNDELTVIVPVYNEKDSLPLLVKRLIPLCKNKGWKVIIVNDGSTDIEQKELNNLLKDDIIRVFHHKLNRGYGGAIKTAVQKVDTPYALTLDGDGQHSIDEIDKLIEVFEAKDADMVIGSRAGKPSVTKLRGFGKWVIRTISRRLINHNLSDLQSGFKLFRTDLAKDYVMLIPNGFSACDILALMFASQYRRVVETSVSSILRAQGESKISYFVVVETLNEILQLALLFNPLRIFLPVSISLFVFGIIWAIPYLIAGNGLSVGAAVFLLGSLNLLLLGFLSEQIVRQRQPRWRS